MLRCQLVLALLGFLVCCTYARHGSISKDLFEDDIKDIPHAEEDGLEETEELLKERRRNPCTSKKCRRGEMCRLNEQKEATCVCVDDCSYYEQGSRFEVCSNNNRTYPSECSLDRDHCQCKRKESGCSEPDARKIYLDYYGHCQENLPCSENSAKQFPRRLRDWLFIVMEEMSRRAAIGEYSKLVEIAANDEHHAFAVIWKFCDLDSDPQDRSVTKRELQYTVRSLRAMEGCLVPFLDDCDANDDRKISLQEWGHCLELRDDEIIDKCVDIHKYKKDNQ